MNVLIFGGAGFIGSFLSKRLQSDGHNVASVDNLITGNIKYLEKLSIKNYNIDITNFDEFNKIDFYPDIIIHLAFPTSLVTRDRMHQYENVSSTGTLNIFEYAKETCNKIIYGSSIAVYGLRKNNIITENSRVEPFLIYSSNKYLGEIYLNWYSYQFGMGYNILRISDVFGPHDRRKNAINNFIISFIKDKKIKIIGDGEQKRSFIYVEDVANSIANSLKKLSNTVYNLVPDNYISINNLLKYLEGFFNKKIEVTYQTTTIDNRDYIFDNSKFKKDFGAVEMIGFLEGLKLTVRYLKGKYENSNTSA